MSDQLKLMALDRDDLAVISAHVQDAVLKSSEVEYFPGEGRLLIPINRFAWEAKSARRWFFKRYERRRSALHFDRVQSIRAKGVDRHDPAQVLALLAVGFAHHNEDDPAGTVELTFAGGAAISVLVECIESQLTDLGAAWATSARPRHGG